MLQKLHIPLLQKTPDAINLAQAIWRIDHSAGAMNA